MEYVVKIDVAADKSFKGINIPKQERCKQRKKTATRLLHLAQIYFT